MVDSLSVFRKSFVVSIAVYVVVGILSVFGKSFVVGIAVTDPSVVVLGDTSTVVDTCIIMHILHVFICCKEDYSLGFDCLPGSISRLISS